MALTFDISRLSQYQQDTYYLAFGSGPMCTETNRRYALAEWEGYRGWGDVDLDIEEELEAGRSAAERAERAAKAAAEEAEKARLEPMIALHHQQQGAMINRARNARNKDRVGFKDARPCRSLYDYDRERGCKTNHISTECWAHEFTDALSSEFLNAKGQLTQMALDYGIPRALKDGSARVGNNQSGVLAVIWHPHGCWMTHPGEPGWNPKWVLNKNVEPAPAPAPPQRHGHHNGHHHHNSRPTNNNSRPTNTTHQRRPAEPQYKPTKKTHTQTQQNRFQLDEDSD
jgi:hypothetical protein